MSKASFKDMPAGRPSRQAPDRSAMLAALVQAEPLKRVNFEVTESLHLKLKIHAAAQGQSIKDFLTAYIDSLPETN
jgi:hypothetical protein